MRLIEIIKRLITKRCYTMDKKDTKKPRNKLIAFLEKNMRFTLFFWLIALLIVLVIRVFGKMLETIKK
jgi:hypothetical protein